MFTACNSLKLSYLYISTSVNYISRIIIYRYAPLSIRLIQHRLRPPLWATLKDSIQTLLQKPVIDEESEIPPIGGNLSSAKRQPKFIIVVFIGGCTFAEISALRFLAQQDDERETRYIINHQLILILKIANF